MLSSGTAGLMLVARLAASLRAVDLTKLGFAMREFIADTPDVSAPAVISAATAARQAASFVAHLWTGVQAMPGFVKHQINKCSILVY